MKNKLFINILLVLGVIVLIFLLIPRSKRSTGWDWMPDMRYSKAYETYQSTDFFYGINDTMSARLPVAGTIPRGYIPNDPTIKNDESLLRSFLLKNEHSGYNQDSGYYKKQAEMSSLLKNPYKSEEVMDRGKELYIVNCQVCHGEKGEGNGYIVERTDGSEGPYGARPPAYSSRLPALTDGAMFYSITYGRGNMGGYAPLLSPSDRWKVICYIKDLAGIKEGVVATSTDSTKVAMVK